MTLISTILEELKDKTNRELFNRQETSYPISVTDRVRFSTSSLLNQKFDTMEESEQFWIIRTAIKTLPCFDVEMEVMGVKTTLKYILLLAMVEDDWISSVEKCYKENNN